MTASDTGALLKAEIRELAHRMVRLEEWTQAARGRQEWAQVGELEEMRLAAQFRRSDLMYDAWCARKDLWDR